jgi:hypothetical protein
MGIDESALGYMHPVNADLMETQAGGWVSDPAWVSDIHVLFHLPSTYK